MKRIVPFLFVIGAALNAACSLAIKAGHHTFAEGALEEARPGSKVIELEVGVQEFADRRIDLAVAWDVVEAPSSTDLQDLRFTGRYHFRRASKLSPYAGAGIGWFDLQAGENVVIPPPFCFVATDPFGCERVGNESLASGFFPNVTFGLNFGITEKIDLVFEDRFDFSKQEEAFDLQSNQITFGARFRLRD